jgi:hypothetical protein
VAQCVSHQNEIDLLSGPNKIYIFENKVLELQQLLEIAFKKSEKEIWVILARMCNEKTAITNLKGLPGWLDQFVRGLEELPMIFTNQLYEKSNQPIKRLQMIFGVDLDLEKEKESEVESGKFNKSEIG